jgi:hypothetical protein
VLLPIAIARRWYHALSSNHLPGVMRPILLALYSVNQRLPPGPAAIPSGLLLAVGKGNSVIVPLGLMRPILLLLPSIDQRLPSAPAVISEGWLWAIGTGNSVMLPAGEA